jgi:hypothetical protein
MKTALGVLSVLAALATFAVPALGAPDPYDIFARSRAYWTQQHYPALIDYKVAVDVVEGGKERAEGYTSEYDAVNDSLQVDPYSDYELAHRVVAKGMNLELCYKLGWSTGGTGGRCAAGNKPLPQIDFMGVPHLAPNYSFGMAPFVPAPTPTPFESAALVDQIRSEFHDPNPRASAAQTSSSVTDLLEIAAVYAHNRDYTIVLLGTDTIDGHACYHLGLTPTREPNRFRIRQAWIDEQTYAPWQLQNALNFVAGPGTVIPWMIHFNDVDGAHYIREEDALSPMSVGGEIYTATSIRFETLHTASMPSLHEVADAGVPLTEPQNP